MELKGRWLRSVLEVINEARYCWHCSRSFPGVPSTFRANPSPTSIRLPIACRNWRWSGLLGHQRELAPRAWRPGSYGGRRAQGVRRQKLRHRRSSVLDRRRRTWCGPGQAPGHHAGGNFLAVPMVSDAEELGRLRLAHFCTGDVVLQRRHQDGTQLHVFRFFGGVLDGIPHAGKSLVARWPNSLLWENHLQPSNLPFCSGRLHHDLHIAPQPG